MAFGDLLQRLRNISGDIILVGSFPGVNGVPVYVGGARQRMDIRGVSRSNEDTKSTRQFGNLLAEDLEQLVPVAWITTPFIQGVNYDHIRRRCGGILLNGVEDEGLELTRDGRRCETLIILDSAGNTLENTWIPCKTVGDRAEE